MKKSAWLWLVIVWLGSFSPAFAGKTPYQWDLNKDGQWLLKLGAQFFVRPEAQGNRSDLKEDREDRDFYIATRLRLTLDFQMMKSFGLHVTLQDARYWGNGIPTGGKVRFSTQRNSLFQREIYLGMSFHESYLYLEFLQKRLRLEVGRIRLFYGDAFVLGDPGYFPQGQSFDTLRLRWKMTSAWHMDVMWFRVRESVAVAQPECTGSCFFEGDDVLSVYVQSRGSRVLQLDFYAFYVKRAPRNTKVLEETNLGYLGMRLKVKRSWFLFSLEPILQVGRDQEKDATAFALRMFGRLKWAAPLRPFVQLQLLLASGDSDPSDESNNQFQPLFNNRRRFYGMVNLLGLSNLIQPTLAVGFWPHRKIKVMLDGRYSLRFVPKGANITGGSHGVFVQDLTGQSGLGLGWEVDARVVWKLSKLLTADAAGGVFVPVNELGGPRLLGNSPAWMMYVRLFLKL